MMRTRILAAATAALLALGMAAGGASPALAAPGNSGMSQSTPESEKKVWVCKYVGTPGVDERLQVAGPGQNNPIEVSVNAIQDDGWDVASGTGWFSDGQGRSYAIGYSDARGGGQGDEPDINECPRPDFPDATPGATTSPATCEVSTGSITFADNAGIAEYRIGEQSYQPGDTGSGFAPADYVITAVPEDNFDLSPNSSPFTVTVAGPAEGECDEEPIVVTPAFSVTAESCPTGSALVGGSISLDSSEGTITFVVTDAEGTEVTDLTNLAPGTYTVTPTAVGDAVLDLEGYDDQAVVAPFDGECSEAEVVIPSFTVVDETCVSGILLQGGSITLDTKGGTISYIVTDADDNVVEDLTDLAPGTYTVTPSPVGDVELGLEGYSDQAVVDAFEGECGSVLPITDAFLAFIDPTCDDREQLDPENFIYDPELAELTILEVEENGDFLVVFETIGEDTQFFQELEGDFSTADHNGFTRTVEEGGTVLVFEGTLAGPNTELCEDEVVVVPPVTVVDDCFEQSYTITAVEGVSYAVSVNGSLPMGVSFEEGEDTATFGADPFDEIVVIATADEGYALDEGYEPFEYTYAFDEDCLPTAPVTTASVTWTQADCLGNPGSYTLTNEPGVIWTVDGVVVAGNTKYTAAVGSTPSIVASLEPASEEFPTGFGWSNPAQQTLWNLVFEAADDCLPTLALTGASNALGGLGVVAILIMMAGTGLVVARRREAVRIQG
ncbi:MAG: hypothetical protein Q7T15_02905 [Microcella sp.]|uniref:MSCRAMM family protein n=1 Tax=Microcella sp. TaxID=1913979 RepID=UPI0027270D41|nr:hypothetical protein [Microcella sp.]MDO8337189.1 hypothetical protein [Microcella sp.]